MSTMDVLAAMGISGFGKETKKKELDPSRFDKSKRQEVCVQVNCLKRLFDKGHFNIARKSFLVQKQGLRKNILVAFCMKTKMVNPALMLPT
jgi:hypothetical protein